MYSASVSDSDILAILRNRDWRLVDPAADPAHWQAFAAQVRVYLQQDGAPQAAASNRLNNAVIGAYCPYLHAACQDDDSQRQSRAYTELWNWVYPRVARKTGGGQDAEDVAQEVFLVIHRKVQEVDRPRGFLAWVNRIIHLQVQSYYQKRDRHPPAEPFEEIDEFTETAETVVAQADPRSLEDVAEAEAELLALLDACFSSKARQQRLVFIERVLHERSVLELTRMLQTTPASIHVLYHRARKHIRRHCPKVIDAIITHLQPSSRDAVTGDLT